MVEFIDALGVKRAIDITDMHNGKYKVLTLYTDKRTYADSITIPLDKWSEFIKSLNDT